MTLTFRVIKPAASCRLCWFISPRCLQSRKAHLCKHSLQRQSSYVSPQWSQLCQSAASRNRCLWGSRLSWAVWRRRASPSLGTSGSRTWRRSPMTQRPVSSSSTPHTRSVQKQELWLVLVCACARTRADMSAKGGAAGTVAWRPGVEADILGRQLMAWEGLSHEGNLLSSFAHSSILSCFTAQRRCDTRSPFVFKWTYWTTVL